MRDDRVKEENTANEERTNLNTALENYLRTSSRLRTAALSYLLGFDAALHARNRCKEFDQIASEMTSDLRTAAATSQGGGRRALYPRISARTGILPAPVRRIQPGVTASRASTDRSLAQPFLVPKSFDVSQATVDWHTCRQTGDSSCRVRTGLPPQPLRFLPEELRLGKSSSAENCGPHGELAAGSPSSRSR